MQFCQTSARAYDLMKSISAFSSQNSYKFCEVRYILLYISLLMILLFIQWHQHFINISYKFYSKNQQNLQMCPTSPTNQNQCLLPVFPRISSQVYIMYIQINIHLQFLCLYSFSIYIIWETWKIYSIFFLQTEIIISESRFCLKTKTNK